MLLVFIARERVRVHDVQHCSEGAEVSGPAAAADADGSVSLTCRELAALRQEMLAEMRRELHKFKSDIIDGVPRFRFLLVSNYLPDYLICRII